MNATRESVREINKFLTTTKEIIMEPKHARFKTWTATRKEHFAC